MADFARNHTVTTICPECQKPWSVEVRLADFVDWAAGKPFRSAFPYLTNDERELFLTGYCTPCWDKLFKDDE